jgi:DNA-binding protein WhiA
LRGAFLAAGFVADPRGDFHLEIAVASEPLAHDLVKLCALVGVTARLNHRRGAIAIYLKSYDDIARLMTVMGATRTAVAVGNVRRMKSVKNNVNRSVNAELANQRRASGAAAEQLELIERIRERPGFAALSPKLREFCELRLAHPELSLADLGQLTSRRSSKSAMYHRYLRLVELDRDYAQVEE